MLVVRLPYVGIPFANHRNQGTSRLIRLLRNLFSKNALVSSDSAWRSMTLIGTKGVALSEWGMACLKTVEILFRNTLTGLPARPSRMLPPLYL